MLDNCGWRITQSSDRVCLLGRLNTYMTDGRRKRPLGIIAASTCSDDSLVAMEVYLCFQLVPQLVVRRPLHVAAEQLNLLHSLKRTNQAICTRFRLSFFFYCLFMTFFMHVSGPSTIRFRSGITEGHFRTVHRFILGHSRMFLAVCFGSLSCFRTHDLRLRPNLLPLGSTFGSRMP